VKIAELCDADNVDDEDFLQLFCQKQLLDCLGGNLGVQDDN
jgi:hypothetical protein